jgi:HEAT repeat protein
VSANQEWRHLVVAGHEGDETVARSGLAAADSVARQLALGALDRMGRLTDEDLQAGLTDDDPTVRHRATLLTAGRPHIALLPLLRDPHAAVVEAAAWAAGEHELVPDDELHELCRLATESDEVLVREAAVAALGAIGDPRGLPAVLAGCSDKPAVRRRAVLALAPFDGPEVDAALAAALEDRDWQVRQAAEDLLPFLATTDDTPPAP